MEATHPNRSLPEARRRTERRRPCRRTAAQRARPRAARCGLTSWESWFEANDVEAAADDFSDLADRRMENLRSTRRVRRWLFRALGLLAVAALTGLLIHWMRHSSVRDALFAWATFGFAR